MNAYHAAFVCACLGFAFTIIAFGIELRELDLKKFDDRIDALQAAAFWREVSGWAFSAMFVCLIVGVLR